MDDCSNLGKPEEELNKIIAEEAHNYFGTLLGRVPTIPLVSMPYRYQEAWIKVVMYIRGFKGGDK